MITRILKLQLNSANLRHARRLYRAMGLSRHASGELMPPLTQGEIFNLGIVHSGEIWEIVEVEYRGQSLRIIWEC
jgi:hypothetical protein